MSCSVQSALAGAPRIAVSVNGVEIPHDWISREAQNHPAPTPIAAWTAAARALVVRELLLQEARRSGLQVEPASDPEGRRETEEEALIRALVEARLAIPVPDEDSCRRYYNNNRTRFRSVDIHEASHILVAARRDDTTAFAAKRERALALLALVQAEPHRFADLARAHSDCPSASAGGNLGQLTKGATTPPFEHALAGLEPGGITPEPVETAYGFHIIRLDRRIAGAALPFEVVHDRIAAYLTDRAQRTALAQFVARLAAQADVKGVELPSAAELRVH
ncbi:MAG TPA: peptidylprolyl isomerase [Hyphomicrobiaceae bacterium]|nr:peptidylprolyl isomerase [Hyphomicrobiaceae bacterium]